MRRIAWEFIRDQLPLALVIASAGVVGSYLQHGFLIGGSRGVPLAGKGVDVGIWHLLLLGFGAGYVAALVGQASGVISLPYSMTVLGFVNVHVTPTLQLETFLGPFGALRGFHRRGQWNKDLALILCAGGVVGAGIGPFIRVAWISDPVEYKAAVGGAMVYVAVQLVFHIQESRRPTQNGRRQSAHESQGDVDITTDSHKAQFEFARTANDKIKITTLEKSWRHIRIGFSGEQRRIVVPQLLGLGCVVGIIASALGLGGGFLVVPLLATIYRLPMRILVSASTLYVITLSATGLLTYVAIIPLLTGRSVAPEWAWGCFTGSGAIVGSWCGAVSQKHVPEKILKIALAILTGGIGAVYLLKYLVNLARYV